MNCDECRDAVVRGEAADEASINAHVAACGSCAAWREQEMTTMGQLQQAGAAWRERGMADEVVARVPVAKRSAVAGRIARFAAAAAVLVVAAGGVYVATRPTSVNAMAVMVHEIRERGSVRFTISAPFLPGRSAVMTVSGERVRIELGNGDVVVSDAGANRTVMLKPSVREMVSVPTAGPAVDMYGLLLGLADGPKAEAMGTETVDGRRAEKYRVAVSRAGQPFAGSVVTVWLDGATRLPVRMEAPVKDPQGNEGVVTLAGFAFDGAVDAGAFDLEPAGYAAVAPSVSTPAIGNQMLLKIRNVGMAFHMYMSEHEGVPETIEQLKPYLEEGGLRSLRRPGEEIGYVYVKPTEPLVYEDVVLYERFAEGDEVMVVLVNSRVEVKTRAEVEEMVKRVEGRRK